MPLHPTPTLILRPATPDDAPGLTALLTSIGWLSRFAQGNPADHIRGVSDMLLAATPDRTLALVAVDAQQRVQGYCATHWLPTAIFQSWDAYVSELFVAETARGAGLGAQLLDAAVAAARAKGCQRIWLINNRDHASYARNFYAQQGWTEQSTMARFALTL